MVLGGLVEGGTGREGRGRDREVRRFEGLGWGLDADLELGFRALWGHFFGMLGLWSR